MEDASWRLPPKPPDREKGSGEESVGKIHKKGRRFRGTYLKFPVRNREPGSDDARK